MKKTITALTVLAIILVCLVFMPTQAEAAVITTGTCGDNLTWTFDDTGTLTISGTGAMTDWMSQTPWIGYQIKTVVIEAGVTTIGSNAFKGCSSLTSVVISGSVAKIGRFAFQYCPKLTGIIIPNSVTDIGYGAFTDCLGLISISIPNSVTNVTSSVFDGCTGLTSIHLPASINNIGYMAFKRCESLSDIYFAGSQKQWDRISIDDSNNFLFAATLHCAINCNNGHHWDDGKVTKGSSCKENGEKTYTCTVCNETKTEPIAKLTTHTYDHNCDSICNICNSTRTVTHQYGNTWVRNQSGHWHVCTICSDETDHASHTPGAAATETTAQTCTKCGYVIQAALGHTHSYEPTWHKDATGHWYACVCGGQKDYSVHTYQNSCDTNCNICGYTRAITHIPGEPATATKDQTCTICGTVLNKATGATTTTPPATQPTTPPATAPTTPPTEAPTVAETQPATEPPSVNSTEPSTQPTEGTIGTTEPSGTDASQPESTPVEPSEPVGGNEKPSGTARVIVAVTVVLLGGGTAAGIIFWKKKH